MSILAVESSSVDASGTSPSSPSLMLCKLSEEKEIQRDNRESERREREEEKKNCREKSKEKENIAFGRSCAKAKKEVGREILKKGEREEKKRRSKSKEEQRRKGEEDLKEKVPL